MIAKIKTYAEVAAKTDIDDRFKGVNSMIKCMKEVYPIVKDEVKFRSFGKKKLTVKNLPNIFDAFVDDIEGDCDDPTLLKIEFDPYRDEYYMNKTVTSEFATYSLYLMSASFLPELNDLNRTLHDLMCECIKIFSYKKVFVLNCPLYYGENWLFETAEEIEQYETTEKIKSHAKKELDTYTRYHKHYSEILNGKPSIKKIKTLLKKVKCKDALREKLEEWVNDMIKFYSHPQDMDEVMSLLASEINNISYEDANKIGINIDGGMSILESMTIIWFGNDGVIDSVCESMAENNQGYGVCPVFASYICKNSQELVDARKMFTEEFGDFPDVLAGLLSAGVELTGLITDYIDNNGKLIYNLDANKNDECRL